MRNSELRLHLNCALDNTCFCTHGVQQINISTFPHFSKNNENQVKHLFIYTEFCIESHGDNQNNNL